MFFIRPNGHKMCYNVAGSKVKCNKIMGLCPRKNFLGPHTTLQNCAKMIKYVFLICAKVCEIIFRVRLSFVLG